MSYSDLIKGAYLEIAKKAIRGIEYHRLHGKGDNN